MSYRIEKVTGLEILDSRGRPTVSATLQLEDGTVVTASVPSGASTGKAEALELRDGDPTRYRGLGCRKAVANVNSRIHEALYGRAFATQAELDNALRELDGTSNKSGLGANAILAVSLAFARAVAAADNLPLYEVFARILDRSVDDLPRPMINLFSGGVHAGGQVAIQDVQVMPLSPTSIADALTMTSAVFHAAAELAHERYQMRLLTADEGGLAPPFPNSEAMLQSAIESIERAGLRPGEDIVLTVDVAASHFSRENAYFLEDQPLSGDDMIELLIRWSAEYFIASVEDGLAEDDWLHWQKLTARAAPAMMILGDDLLCTNPARIQKAADENAANALLLKVNQIGTLTEAASAFRLARESGWRVVVSARSGETEDDWLADLAFGWGGDYIKVGSITQSERLAKYNRLLAIEAATGARVR